MTPKVILLALASPLYAPLYLAKARTLTSAWANVTFEYPRPPRIEKEMIHDPLLNQLLETHTPHRKCILAAADPMRVLNFPAYAGQDKPYVVKTLIKTMCYWALDAERLYNADEPFNVNLRGLIVHPQGMTGYTVPLYDMLCNQNITFDQDTIADFLFDAINPGEEKVCYKILSRRPRKDRKNKQLGFVTMDPVQGNLARANRAAMRLIKQFSLEPCFQDVIMTGLITGRELYDDSHNRAYIDELLDGVRKAMDVIYNDPVIAAHDLEKYEDAYISFRTDYRSSDLAHTLRDLAKMDAYDPDPQVNNGHLDKSKMIIDKVKAFLPTFRRALKDVDGFFNLTGIQTPSV